MYTQGFQFHKGTIRTTYLIRLRALTLRFNYIKVRLEQALGGDTLVCMMFQFHKGTIRTLWVMLILCVVVSFNSIKVRLELISLLLTPRFSFVSIP